MKVIEVIRGLGLGGSESQLVQRLEYMSRNPALDVQTLAVINAYSGEQFFAERLEKAEVVVEDLGTSNRWTSLFLLWRRAKRFPDGAVVVVHSPWPALALKVMKASGRFPHALVEVASSTHYARPLLFLGRWLNRYADAFIAVSDDVAQAPTVAGARAVHVVHAGVDRHALRRWVESNPSAPADYRSRLGMRRSDRLLAMVGNLYHFKGQDNAIRALQSLDSDIHLVLAGDGPEGPELTSLAIRLGVRDRVHFVGREANAWRWAAVADIVVHPSRREGLPVALIEARVLGTPVIATDVGGISAVLRTDRSSIVVPEGDGVAFASALRARLRDAVPIELAFARRAAVANEWDVARFVREFYEKLREVEI